MAQNASDRMQEIPNKVTTGALPASKKVYIQSEFDPSISVPFREVSLDDTEMPTIQLYDTSGPYTDEAVNIDIQKGLSRLREAWVKKRDTQQYEGRDVKVEDNGGATGDKLAPEFPIKNKPYKNIGPGFKLYFDRD